MRPGRNIALLLVVVGTISGIGGAVIGHELRNKPEGYIARDTRQLAGACAIVIEMAKTDPVMPVALAASLFRDP